MPSTPPLSSKSGALRILQERRGVHLLPYWTANTTPIAKTHRLLLGLLGNVVVACTPGSLVLLALGGSPSSSLCSPDSSSVVSPWPLNPSPPSPREAGDPRKPTVSFVYLTTSQPHDICQHCVNMLCNVYHTMCQVCAIHHTFSSYC